MMRLTCKSFTASACDQLNYSDRLFLRFCEVQVTTLWFMEETAFNHFQFRAPESILRWFMSTIFEKITWSHPLRFPEMNSLKRSFNNLSLTFQSSAGLVIDSNSSASRPFYEGFCNCSYMNTSDFCFKWMKFPQNESREPQSKYYVS